MNEEISMLAKFMAGLDSATFAKAICYFSAGRKYLSPRELREFWESLSQNEKAYYRREILGAEIVLS